MQQTVVEIATIKLAPGRTEAELDTASAHFQQEFLRHQPGFLRRELVRQDESNFADIVHWRSIEDAEAVATKIAGSAACESYFSVMDFDPEHTMAGVTHYTLIADYPADAMPR